MDWAARFIDSIYNRIDANIYAREYGIYTLIHSKQIWEYEAKRVGVKTVYDEIRKTVRFVQ